LQFSVFIELKIDRLCIELKIKTSLIELKIIESNY